MRAIIVAIVGGLLIGLAGTTVHIPQSLSCLIALLFGASTPFWVPEKKA